MSNIHSLTTALIAFRNDRDWQQFHTPKNLAISLSLEASELLELFQWKNDAEATAFIQEHSEMLADELADVFNWVLIIAHDTGIDIVEAAARKIDKNAQKYPIEKAKGRHTKYTQL